MAVKVITLDGESTATIGTGKDKIEKPIKYRYPKIVTPATKRNRGTEAEQKDATFFTFAEITKFLGGNVEFPLKKEVGADGKETGKMVLDEDKPTSICQYIMDGWNLEKNIEAKDAQINTPAVQRAKMRLQLVEMKTKAAKDGLPTDGIDMMLAELDAKDKAEAEAEAAATKAQEEADKKEAEAERKSRSRK